MKFIKGIIISVLCCFIITGCKTKSFTIATWNIGHFANGTSPNSLIKGEDYGKKLELYRMLFEDMDADILCLNEYSESFGSDSKGVERKTREVLLNNYEKIAEGNQVGLSCNAFFSHFNITKVERHEFKSTTEFVKELPRAANYYYLSCDLRYKRKTVKIVCAHTISSNSSLCQKMIAEIIEAYNNYDRVVLCGDWNTGNYRKFIEAGYSLGNDGAFKTYPQKSFPLDNIMVKGLKINEVRMIRTDLSDHCPLICNISLK